MFRIVKRSAALGVAMGAVIALSACSSPTPAPAGPTESALDSVTAGWVSSIDQIGLPAALDQGFFDEYGLDVDVADPFATGVDQLNALETGAIQFAQVGSPFIGAKVAGADYVIVGNYTGSASQFGIDETMAVIAREGSGVQEGDLSTILGKKIGVAVGSINHLYLLAVLEDLGATTQDVQIVNTAPPDLGVALQTGGIDVAVSWDPWPLQNLAQVEGSYEVARGGGYIGFLGYIVAKRDFVEENPETVEAFLAARAAADRWIRDNPSDAAGTASRWLSSLDPVIAEASMDYNVQQLDPRISACNYAALDSAVATLNELGSIDGTIDVNEVFVPGPITNVINDHPELFDDLTPIPSGAQWSDGFAFDPAGSQCSR
ncbi:ABC transporter substrate-binding protein [Microbacterium jiangjiandongii]|uniref:ABC transporter substrate-binding protein n=1 Tax=Microbacterium jiangjiandongii TaxID=3049071 RepID=UPI00214A931A|nr:NrtA/SsuA/CpmA family ABC transporter substrate-binding protein [Microbacterium sp. zg.Y843]MCR2815018.1 NrtA/SsuA/CpmA family ABC transporter substrate-binding protein [Microbacterium sp. zg.Y843]